MRFSETIKRWFDENLGGGLLLPDGWYGRPYDNQHMLTSVDESGEALILVLDQRLVLHFDRLDSIDAKPGELTLGPFEKVRFERQSGGTSKQGKTDEYTSGVVKILCAPGSCRTVES